jgi:peptidoglycan/LPS O-acetylase OafA/YrhL
MLHFTFTQIKPLGFIAQYGFAGVDIFMLVSGFGLYFSLDNNNNIKDYYRKRLLRICPTYYILGIFASILLFHDSLFIYLFRYSTIGFWIGDVYGEWYIPSIVILYLLAPFIKKLFDRNFHLLIGFLGLICLLVSYILVSNNFISKSEPHFFFLYRIPAFLFGMTCAYWIKKDIFVKYYFFILLAGLPFFAYLFPLHHEIYNFKYLSLAFLLPLFTFTFIIISKYIKFINPLISQIGKASLEVYLIQGMFFHAIIKGDMIIPKEYHDMISIVLMVISSLLGIVTHWLIDKSRIAVQTLYHRTS